MIKKKNTQTKMKQDKKEENRKGAAKPTPAPFNGRPKALPVEWCWGVEKKYPAATSGLCLSAQMLWPTHMGGPKKVRNCSSRPRGQRVSRQFFVRLSCVIYILKEPICLPNSGWPNQRTNWEPSDSDNFQFNSIGHLDELFRGRACGCVWLGSGNKSVIYVNLNS